MMNGEPVIHVREQTYLGVTLDRTLTFKKPLSIVKAKLQTRNNLIRKLAGITWGATPTIWLPAICDIVPQDLRRKKALLRDYGKIINNPEPQYRYTKCSESSTQIS